MAQDKAVTVSSIAELAASGAGDGMHVKMKPGVYQMADYLTKEVLAEIEKGVDRSQSRPPVPMFVFRGDGNQVEPQAAWPFPPKAKKAAVAAAEKAATAVDYPE